MTQHTLELAAGDSVDIDGYDVTILDIEGDRVLFRIDGQSITASLRHEADALRLDGFPSESLAP